MSIIDRFWNPRPQNDYWQRCNNTLNRFLQDFPWLWAVKQFWHASDAQRIRVSQDMYDLRTVLSNQSQGTRFGLWILQTQYCNVVNWELIPVQRQESKTWAECLHGQARTLHEVEYIVVVDPVYGDDHPSRDIIIFRAPKDTSLNEVVKHALQLQGSEARTT